MTMFTRMKWQIRRLVPDLSIRIDHVVEGIEVEVSLRRDLGLVVRGLSSFEPLTRAVIRRVLRPGDVFVDVGAHIGVHSTLGAHLVGDEGRVLAYEPDPVNREKLRKNIEMNSFGNAEVHGLALGDTKGCETFARDPLTGCTGRLGEEKASAEEWAGTEIGTAINVPVSTLDEELEGRSLDPGLVKIDVEGKGNEVLEGARGTLVDSRPEVVVEAGTDAPSQVTRLLAEEDYRMWDMETGERVHAGEEAWMIVATPSDRGGKLSHHFVQLVARR